MASLIKIIKYILGNNCCCGSPANIIHPTLGPICRECLDSQ